MAWTPEPSGRALAVSFAAVAVTFTAAIAVDQVYGLRIRSAAQEITANASPSISRLSSMRGGIRALEVLAEEHVGACERGQCGPAPARVEALRSALGGDWAEYRALPTFPGERDAWPAAERAMARLGEELALTFAATAAGRADDAQASLAIGVKPACDRLDEIIARMIEFEHGQGVAVAARIDALAGRSLAASIVLVLASVALTALAATLALRAVRRYERSLHDRAEELDQFAGRIAHDVMSPLASTSAAIYAARKSATEQGLAALARAERGLQRVRRLVEDLLEFARAGAPRGFVGATEVRGVLADVADELGPLADANRVELRVEPAPAGAVACTSGVLTSVVSNLVRNAITHMGPSPVRQVVVRVEAPQAARQVRIEVADTGPGIPPALGEQVFEPFVRGPAEQPGSGLGLATAKRIVTAHGGRIGFTPREGGGTLFWVELPSAHARVAARA